MIFKNWLDAPPNMETHDPTVYSTILGGVSRGFWSLFLDRGAQSAIFWHLKTGTFALLSLQQGATFTSPLPATISTANYNIFSLFQTCFRPVFAAGAICLLLQANTIKDAKVSLRRITSF